jgi:hypothetical protein
MVLAALKWCANENGSPSRPASCALYPLEPSSHIAGMSPRPGVAVIRAGASPPMNSLIRSASSSGNASADRPSIVRRSASAVSWSVPGARPMPRSMRPGCSASRVPNCSATTSGAWLGSMTPPEPTRIEEVAAARWAISTAGAELAIAGMLWCSATQKRR